jgi:hypothetical protein
MLEKDGLHREDFPLQHPKPVVRNWRSRQAVDFKFVFPLLVQQQARKKKTPTFFIPFCFCFLTSALQNAIFQGRIWKTSSDAAVVMSTLSHNSDVYKPAFEKGRSEKRLAVILFVVLH